MEPEFNTDQVFQIAGRIQQNAADFYQKMAKLFYDSGRRNICLRLADHRAEQAKAIAEERKRFFGSSGLPGTYKSDDYIMSHPSEMADLTIFSHDRYHSMPLCGRESREVIFKDAIGRCEAVIIFFQGLKEFVRDAFTESFLDKLIEDEKRYISLLRTRAIIGIIFSR